VLNIDLLLNKARSRLSLSIKHQLHAANFDRAISSFPFGIYAQN